jgi:branched-chain amino acid transport system substrate-binding protein
MATWLPHLQRLLFPVAAAATLNLAMSCGAQAAEAPIKVGLVAALSGQSAKSGEALTRGLSMAINEVNASGGVLGR